MVKNLSDDAGDALACMLEQVTLSGDRGLMVMITQLPSPYLLDLLVLL